MLVGPKSNPAHLEPSTDDVLAMFNKIVTYGNADVAVSEYYHMQSWFLDLNSFFPLLGPARDTPAYPVPFSL